MATEATMERAESDLASIEYAPPPVVAESAEEIDTDDDGWVAGERPEDDGSQQEFDEGELVVIDNGEA